MYSLRRWLYRPKRSDSSLLAQFYFADEELNLVAAELDSFEGRKDPERCTAMVNQLRSCQARVLNVVSQMMDETVKDQRAPRDFRVKFPDDVIQENLAGQLWFGAECLAAGSSIMNREVESACMRPLARALTKNLDSLRTILREQCLQSVNDYTDTIKESLIIFDKLFAEFELSYVSAMVPVKTAHEYDMVQEMTVLFSETVQRALRTGLLIVDMIDEYDPALMFTIPRLAIICGLLIFKDGPLNPDNDPWNISEMFRPFQTLLLKIRELLEILTESELMTLERALCSQEEPSYLISLEEKKKAARELKRRHKEEKKKKKREKLLQSEGDDGSVESNELTAMEIAERLEALALNFEASRNTIPGSSDRQAEPDAQSKISEASSASSSGLSEADTGPGELELHLSPDTSVQKQTQHLYQINNHDSDSLPENDIISGAVNAVTPDPDDNESLLHHHIAAAHLSPSLVNIVSATSLGVESSPLSGEDNVQTVVIQTSEKLNAETENKNKDKDLKLSLTLGKYESSDSDNGSLEKDVCTASTSALCTPSSPTSPDRDLPSSTIMKSDSTDSGLHISESMSLSGSTFTMASSDSHQQMISPDIPTVPSPLSVANLGSGNKNCRSEDVTSLGQKDICEDVTVVINHSADDKEHLGASEYVERKSDVLKSLEDKTCSDNESENTCVVLPEQTECSNCECDNLDKTPVVYNFSCDNFVTNEDSNAVQNYECETASQSSNCAIKNIPHANQSQNAPEEGATASFQNLPEYAQTVKELTHYKTESNIPIHSTLNSSSPITTFDSDTSSSTIHATLSSSPSLPNSLDSDNSLLRISSGEHVSSQIRPETSHSLASCPTLTAQTKDINRVPDVPSSAAAALNIDPTNNTNASSRVVNRIASSSQQPGASELLAKKEKKRASSSKSKVKVKRGTEEKRKKILSPSTGTCVDDQLLDGEEGCVSSETSSYTSECGDQEEIALAIEAVESATRHQVRARFKGSSDMIHRLFVCISGVADQLQTNFAGDLRNILRSVFDMNCSEPVDIIDGDKAKDTTPLGAAYIAISNASRNARRARTSSNQSQGPPAWLPDKQSTECMSCSVPFSFVRRRHHCRNCGKIFCSRCSSNFVPLPHFGQEKCVRVCNRCYMFRVTPFTVRSSTQ